MDRSGGTIEREPNRNPRFIQRDGPRFAIQVARGVSVWAEWWRPGCNNPSWRPELSGLALDRTGSVS